MPSAFQASRRLERWYGVQLRKLAATVDKLVRGISPNASPNILRDTLLSYAQTVTPWAEAVGARMVADADRENARVWFQRAAEMGSLLRASPDYNTMVERQQSQVSLITSLPREAAERVQHLAAEARVKGTRAEDLAKEILRTGEVTKSRANMIARTEVSKTATLLTQSRAESIGSPGYKWRTVTDSDVRPSHKKMEGQFVAWDSPPILDGLTGHAGTLPNCRCYCEPLIPGVDQLP